MKPLIAKSIYYLIQNLRGEKVFQSLRQLTESQWWLKEKLEEIQWQKTKTIIRHAYNNVPYYREKFDEYGITPNRIKDYCDFKNIPILTKEELKVNSLKLMANDNRYRFSKDSTSGSSGPATIVFTDRNASAFQHAAVFRAYQWTGLDIGDKIVRFWGSQFDFKRKVKDRIKEILLNRLTLSTHNLDDKNLIIYYQQLKSFKPKAIYGFASAIYEFAGFIAEHELSLERVNIHTVIVTGEPLFSYQRKLIEDVFRCKVYNEYGCAEFGPIAYECPERKMHIMAENIYIETEDEPQNVESIGKGNLIITELNNFGMPIIRYRLGDVGIVSKSICNCGRGLPLLEEISGRTIDFVKTPDGKVIHGISFDYLPKYFLEEIKQFQLVQEDPYTIRLNIIRDVRFNEQTIEKLQKKLRTIIGSEIKIYFDFKEAIPREKTGKLRFVISKVTSQTGVNAPI